MLNDKTIRVLVVDDSALMRKLLSEIISGSEDMVTVGTARDGEDALAKTRALHPDVITLDIEMPVMNGLEFLKLLMKERPTPVLVVSSTAAEGGETTLACLVEGAFDFVAKPSGNISLNLCECDHEIVTKIRQAASVSLNKRHAPPLPPHWTTPLTAPPSFADGASDFTHDTSVIVIASSTGGPAALSAVIPKLPVDLNAAYVLIQHLPPGFTRSLADRLNRESSVTVQEARSGDPLMRGAALVAPAGYHLELGPDSRVVLNTEPTLWGVRPAADVTMRSLANRFGRQVIGVVLTGMGRDGALGVQAIKKAGGVSIAQDEESCIVYGMPRCAFETGAVEQLVSLPRIAATLVSIVHARTTVTH